MDPSTHYVHSFFYKNKRLDFAKKIKNKQREQSQSCCHTEHKNKVSPLSILKIKRTKEQSLAVTYIVTYCIKKECKKRWAYKAYLFIIIIISQVAF